MWRMQWHIMKGTGRQRDRGLNPGTTALNYMICSESEY